MAVQWQPKDRDNVYPWKKYGQVHVRGYAWAEDAFLHGEKLADFLDVYSKESLLHKLRALNGHFAVVITGENFFACAVDRLRTFPLFYSRYEDSLIFTDHLAVVKEQLNTEAVDAFRALYFTEGHSTLLRDRFQLLAGEYIWLQDNELKVQPEQYYVHLDAQKLLPREVDPEQISAVHFRVMQRQVASTNGRPVAILLSGGYDSRWLMAEWRVRHRGPLYAITYGKPGSYDMSTAHKIAEKLRVKMIFIPYTRAVLNRFGTAEWQEYAEFSHNAVSTPYEQDFFALAHIHEQHLIPEDTIVIPGFCGDLLGGSVFDVFEHEWSKTGLRQHIKKKYGADIKPGLPESIRITDKQSFWDAWQHWFVVNRVSKFLVNGVRAYSFFGYEWRLPLWDNELVEYWYKVPLKLRLNQPMYEDWLFRQVFEEMELDEWEKPWTDANSDNSRIKAFLKRIIPANIVETYRQKRLASGAYDPNNLLYLYDNLEAVLKSPPRPKTWNFNDVHSRYVLEQYWLR